MEKKKSLWHRFIYSQKVAPYVFVLPFIISFVLWWIYPMISTVTMSFQDIKPTGAEWVGLKNYSKLLKARSVEQLVVEGLVKHVKQTDFKTVETVKSTEVNELLDDASAKEEVVELVTRPKKNDKYKLEIVNIDTISQHFENGETVTLEEVKNRVPFFNRRATALKVLARGELDKKLTFVADDYSMDAIKMILLVGGTVVRNKKQ